MPAFYGNEDASVILLQNAEIYHASHPWMKYIEFRPETHGLSPFCTEFFFSVVFIDENNALTWCEGWSKL
jgi:hypothetical protein